MVEKNESLRKQLELADQKRQDITPLCDLACKIQEQIHHAKVNLTCEIYIVRLLMTRVRIIAAESLDFRKGLMEVA